MLVKNVRSRELVEQLQGLARGEAAISRRMAARILEEIRAQAEGPVVFQRTYASLATSVYTTPLAYGWTHNHATSRMRTGTPPRRPMMP
jgi:hypothetical protein